MLYHSTFSQIPRELAGEIHNVTPDILYEQLCWLKDNFDVVPVDVLLRSTDQRGKAAVTFDDAYKSVFVEALPVLESLDMPSTVFINGCTLDKTIFWRDKIRFLISESLVDAFISKNIEFCAAHGISDKNFYRRTKHHSVNSQSVDILIDKFFDDRSISLDALKYCIDEPAVIPKTDLVSYGSHSYSHYVLASLTEEQQRDEIGKNVRVLEDYGLNQSRVFSIPFGDESSFNETTVELLQEFGYEAFLYSRNRLGAAAQRRYPPGTSSSMVFGDRYMPKSSMLQFQWQIVKLNWRRVVEGGRSVRK